MNTKGISALIAIGAITGLASTGAFADVIHDGGFEVSGSTGLRLPQTYAQWSGDIAEVVTAQDDITPFEGTQMVHFMYSTANGPMAGPIGCELWQIIDVSAYRGMIDRGNAVASAEGWFNRIGSEDSPIDTQFSIVLSAYTGNAADFPSMWLRDEIALSEGVVYTDGNVNTWQMAQTSMRIPVATDFLAYRITSTEDIFDDGSGIEFHGHYGDGFTMDITEVPAPASLVMMLGGALTMGVRRRRAA